MSVTRRSVIGTMGVAPLNAMKARRALADAFVDLPFDNGRDYISTQPRGLGFGHAFWDAEVHKMIAVYGAPIEPAGAPRIVDHLASAYEGTYRTGVLIGGGKPE